MPVTHLVFTSPRPAPSVMMFLTGGVPKLALLLFLVGGKMTSGTLTYSSFTYQQMSTNRYATPLPSPLTQSTFAPLFSEASALLPANVTYTTYSLQPTETLSDDGEYGQKAYASLWAKLTYSNTPPFTTTVSPTPVASGELVFPPALPAHALDEDSSLKLPADFVWGVAGSAWQAEGGLQVEGRAPSIIDAIGAVGLSTEDDANVADMNYFMYKQDIARIAALGVPYYSFSISWSRVVPFGVEGSPVNKQALEHYEDLISTCLQYGVTPIATLAHFDYPAGAMTNTSAFPAHFLYYAKQVMARYADRVPYWITFNEPNLIVPPYVSYSFLPTYLLAHAKLYHWYKEELNGNGQISMKLANNLALPLDPSNVSDVETALRYQDFDLGILSNPLYLGKQYPQTVLNTSDIGITALTAEELAYIHGTADFYAVDPYISQFASAAAEGLEACSADSSNSLWPTCAVTTNLQANGWYMGAPSISLPYIAPQYVREQLGFIWNTYKPKAILVTEFGFPVYAESEMTLDQQRYDFERSMYYQNFLAETLHAIHDDGVNIIGTLAWSWADNNQFGSYAIQYGMQTVNRTDGTFERHYKRSFFDYVDFFHDHIVQ